MKTNKVNNLHPVYVSLRDWSREPAPVFAIKHENKSRQLVEIQSALRLMEEMNKAKECNMSNMEIKTATMNEYKWLKRLALAREDYFLAEYYENLIKEIES